MRKREGMRIAVLSCLLFAWTVIPAGADYVDPSVLTYAIQAAAGVFITLGTVIGLYGRKLKSLAGKRKGSEAKDVTGDDLVFHDPVSECDRRALYFLSEEEKQALAEQQRIQKQKEAYSLRSGLLVACAVSMLWMCYSPMMLYLTNRSEFRYDLYSILPAILLMSAAALAVSGMLFWLSWRISKPVYTFLTGFGFLFLVVCANEGIAFAGSLPPLDGTAFDWSAMTGAKVQSYVLIAVCTILILVVAIRKGGAFLRKTAGAGSLLVMIFLAVLLLVSGIASGGFLPKRSASVTDQDEFTFSSDENLIILILDAADSGLFRRQMEGEDPQYRDVFEDFTYYPNTVGCYTYTEHAVPFILSGKWMENQEAFETFETKALDDSPLFRTLEAEGYRMGLYEDALVYESDGVYRFENVKDDRYKLDSIGEYARQSFYMTWFQYMPYPLKPLLSREDSLSNIQNRAIGKKRAFIGNNAHFYQQMQENPITVTEDRCFRFIHLEGAHVPFRYDKDVNVIPQEEGSYSQNMEASITLTDAFLKRLKESGVYDNSAVIIMADHGYTDDDANSLLGRCNPLLLIKGKQERHELNVSEQPVSYEDLQETYQRLLKGTETAQLFDVREGDVRFRRFLAYEFNKPEIIREYLQLGYASDMNSMYETGNDYIQN